LRSVKLEGTFKTANSGFEDADRRLLGFASFLSIYTLILGKVCVNMRKLTLNIEKGKDFSKISARDCPCWDNGLWDVSGRSDLEKIDEIVGKVVRGLPNLRELRLGEYKTPFKLESSGETVEGWGTSFYWMEDVKERFAKRTKREVKNSA
jgi:hypothetical protein